MLNILLHKTEWILAQLSFKHWKLCSAFILANVYQNILRIFLSPCITYSSFFTYADI